MSNLKINERTIPLTIASKRNFSLTEVCQMSTLKTIKHSWDKLGMTENKWRDTCLWMRRLNIVKMSLVSKLNYPNQNQMIFCFRNWPSTDFKIYMEITGPGIAIIILTTKRTLITWFQISVYNYSNQGAPEWLSPVTSAFSGFRS